MYCYFFISLQHDSAASSYTLFFRSASVVVHKVTVMRVKNFLSTLYFYSIVTILLSSAQETGTQLNQSKLYGELSNQSVIPLSNNGQVQRFYPTLLVLIESQVVKRLCALDPETWNEQCCSENQLQSKTPCSHVKEYYTRIFRAVRHLYRDIDHSLFEIEISISAIEVIPDVVVANIKHYAEERLANHSTSEHVVGALVAVSDASKEMSHIIDCSPGNLKYNIAMFEETAGYSSVFTAAHAVGHFLGADHDGVYTECGGGAADKLRLMAPSFDTTRINSTLVYQLSCCSLADIYNWLSIFGRCTLSAPGSQILNMLDQGTAEKEIGEYITREVYCVMIFGRGFIPCKLENSLDQCEGIYCRKNNSANSQCTKHKSALPVLNGMPCNQNHTSLCRYGQCISRNDTSKQYVDFEQSQCNIRKVPSERIKHSDASPSPPSPSISFEIIITIVGLVLLVIGIILSIFCRKKTSVEPSSTISHHMEIPQNTIQSQRKKTIKEG